MDQILTFPERVLAHRGASAYAPENTLAAFSKAVDLGISWVEFDVMQAACGEVIVFHDELLDRTTNGVGDIALKSYADLQLLDAGAWFEEGYASEKIPTLVQTLQFLNANHISANIELKSLPGDEEKLVIKVLEIVRELGPFSGTILYSSFAWDALKILRHYSPDSCLGLLIHEWEKGWELTSKQLNCVAVHVFEELMSPEAARYIKQLNKHLLCYTVNSVPQAKELFNWGVDAVFSDCPDKIKAI